MSWVPGPIKKNIKRKVLKLTSGRRRRAQEIRHQKEEQTVKRGSGLQQGYPVLQSSQQIGTPLPPRH